MGETLRPTTASGLPFVDVLGDSVTRAPAPAPPTGDSLNAMPPDPAGAMTNREFERQAWAAVAAVILFNSAWLVAGWVQGPPYSAALHDISDLGALSARSPWLMLVPEASAGVLTIAFALRGLRPAMMSPGRREPIGAWMVAFSLMGLDNLSDLFFRLPCMAVEPGCSVAVATATWQGALHYAFGVGTALVTVVAPFVLASRMRTLPGWRDLARGAIGFGVLLVVLLISYLALEQRYGQGFVQRAMALVVGAGVLILARRLRALGKGGQAPPPG